MAARRVLAWFRRDLRLHDNRMLAEATRAERVWPVLVADERIVADLAHAPGRMAWYGASVRALDDALRARGSGLTILRGRPEEVLPDLAARVGAEEAVAAASDEPAGVARDERVASRLRLRLVEDLRLTEPGELTTASGRIYSLFSPFRRALEQRLETEPWRIAAASADLGRLAPPADRDAFPREPAPMELPPAGEGAATDRLSTFVSQRLDLYRRDRDLPDRDGTSGLSPYLRVGALSVRDAWRAARAADGAGPASWRGELAWREFFHQVLAAWPDSLERATGRGMDRVAWEEGAAADEALAAWSQGRTGYPMVDAGMRQLVASGWMHNRLRMVAASFLVKDLGVDWRRGASVFLEHLLDGDLAQNTGNWQWVAGTGTASAPYFRILSPIQQGRRFDPHGRFVRAWIPDLADVPDHWVHEPWAAPVDRRPRDYPAPLVDHAAARERTMQRFAAARSAR